MIDFTPSPSGPGDCLRIFPKTEISEESEEVRRCDVNRCL
jgi:hypothetical protein